MYSYTAYSVFEAPIKTTICGCVMSRHTAQPSCRIDAALLFPWLFLDDDNLASDYATRSGGPH